MEENFPSELSDRLTAFDESLSKIDDVMQALHGTPLSQLHDKLSSLDKARLDLLGVYAVNSLFWMYLNCKGENPKEHGVKQELDRVRRYMDRVKEVQEKLSSKRPELNKSVAKRFLRSALWQAAHSKASAAPESEGNKDEDKTADPPVSTTNTSKRTIDLTTAQSNSEPKKKMKKKKKQN